MRLPPMLQQREHIMTPAEIEGRRVVARRLFYALRALSRQIRCFEYPTTRRSGRRARTTSLSQRLRGTARQRAGARLRLFRGWELDRRSAVHLTSSRATARRIAANIAKLPVLLRS